MAAQNRLFLTGGAGCLGANLVEHLLAARVDGKPAWEILILDNFATSSPESLPPESGQLQIITGDIGHKSLVDGLFDTFRPTHVVHAAAAYKDPDDWASDTQTNVTGTIHVAQAALRSKVVRFINLQTALCYGRPSQVPVPVTHRLAPFTSYGISKTAGEQYLVASGLPLVSLRLANVTGPRLSIGPIPTFYTRLKAGKSCFCSATTRDFLDMSDFLDLMDLVLDPKAPLGVFNVSTGEATTIKQVFDCVADYLAIIPLQEPPILPPGQDDVAHMVLDPSQTKAILGWEAKVGFQQMMQAMLSWYDENGVRAVYAHVKAPAGTKST